MDKVEQAFKFLTSRGFDKKRFCVGGGAGLQILTRIAADNGGPVLLEREIDDVDIFCLADQFDEATRLNGFETSHDNGFCDCLNIHVPGGLNIELTRDWPTLLSSVRNEQELRAVSIETAYGLVLDPSLTAALKLKRRQQKDLLDLARIAEAHRRCGIVICLP